MHDADGFNCGFHIVDPEDVCPLEQGNGVNHGGAAQCLLWCTSQQVVNHAFSAYTHEQGQVQLMQEAQLGKQLVVVLQRLAEPEAGVQDDVAHAHLVEQAHTFSQGTHHLNDHILIVGV